MFYQKTQPRDILLLTNLNLHEYGMVNKNLHNILLDWAKHKSDVLI